jgi:hypothetical protein
MDAYKTSRWIYIYTYIDQDRQLLYTLEKNRERKKDPFLFSLLIDYSEERKKECLYIDILFLS